MRAQPCTFCSSTDFNMLLMALDYFFKSHIDINICVDKKVAEFENKQRTQWKKNMDNKIE